MIFFSAPKFRNSFVSVTSDVKLPINRANSVLSSSSSGSAASTAGSSSGHSSIDTKINSKISGGGSGSSQKNYRTLESQCSVGKFIISDRNLSKYSS